MIAIFHAAELAECCFLSELLYWVALKRFPLAIYDVEGSEFRFSSECELYANSAIESPVSDAECEFAGLPFNPRYRALIEERTILDAKLLQEMEKYVEVLSGVEREDMIARRQQAFATLKEVEVWDR
jgi:hypothetical protein